MGKFSAGQPKTMRSHLIMLSTEFIMGIRVPVHLLKNQPQKVTALSQISTLGHLNRNWNSHLQPPTPTASLRVVYSPVPKIEGKKPRTLNNCPNLLQVNPAFSQVLLHFHLFV